MRSSCFGSGSSSNKVTQGSPLAPVGLELLAVWLRELLSEMPDSVQRRVTMTTPDNVVGSQSVEPGSIGASEILFQRATGVYKKAICAKSQGLILTEAVAKICSAACLIINRRRTPAARNYRAGALETRRASCGTGGKFVATSLTTNGRTSSTTTKSRKITWYVEGDGMVRARLRNPNNYMLVFGQEGRKTLRVTGWPWVTGRPSHGAV